MIPRDLYYCNEYKKIKKLLSNKMCISEELKRELLVKQLKNAIENVPYYRELNINISSKEIKKENVYEILNLFPYLDKKTIMDNTEKFISDKIDVNSKRLLKRTSGGSTGNGIKVYRILKELMIERAFYDHEWEKYGYKSSSKIVRMGCDGIKNTNENPFTKKGNKLFISPYHLNNKWIDEIYNKILEHKVEYFHVYPSNIEYLARYMKRKNKKINTTRAIFLASERVSEELLNLLKEVFQNVNISFSYGLTERTNLAWGEFNGEHISYRIEELYGYHENFVTEDNRYEIVGTSYWNFTMPFIRYRTQDFGRINNGYIESLDGRNQEFLVTKQNNKIPGFTISIDKFVWDYVEAFQVIQNEIGKVEFYIVPKSNFNSTIERKILKSQENKWGEFFDMKIIIKNEILRTDSGKYRLVINNIKI